IEQYHITKKRTNNFDLYYERRTAQFRDEDNIQKTKIITIPTQIKCTSAMFLNLPHEVSGQYGKVERTTRGLLFRDDKDLAYLNTYYVSGLAWYRVERFIANNDEGKKFRRARWHLIMLLKIFCCNVSDINMHSNGRQEIGVNSEKISQNL
ncbi:AIPR family protein, partial [Acinetobacter courvalinii]|uniref:AIPR family protein n=1 Tax=Acinetobacter courvalinii TaxID=280147 RepID=UPI003A85679F